MLGKSNLFWQKHTVQAFKSFSHKVYSLRVEETETEPLFYNDNINVGNKTKLIAQKLESNGCL